MKTAADLLQQFDLHPPSTTPGRYYTTCWKCSPTRSRAHQQLKCLGITIDDMGVQFGCNHCGWTGGGYYNGSGKLEFEATYEYVDENGELLFQVCRRRMPDGGKEFPQRKPNGHGGWTWSTKDVRKVLFRLPELNEAIANEHLIAVPEGEKDVLNLVEIGIIATCNPGGASEPGKRPKWRADYSETLRGADIVIMPDHDASGYAHAEAVARMSVGIAKRVRILSVAKHWPECPKGGDISDWLAAGHTREELDELIQAAPDYNGVIDTSNGGLIGMAADDLCSIVFEPVNYVVPAYIVEGLTLFAGKPKVGKSWLLLHAAIAVARGGFTLGEVKCPEGDVLYCGLEDNKRRLQRRLKKLLGDQPAPKRLRVLFAGEMPLLSQGGLDLIRTWIKQVDKPRLVVIDVLAKVRDARRKDQGLYDADYAAVSGLKALADEFSIAIVVVTHLRKLEAEDPLDQISATTGLTGSADAVLVLHRTGVGTTLSGRGRDIEDIAKAVQFNTDACTWTVLGEASEVVQSAARAAILAALIDAREPMAPAEIADLTGMPSPSTRRTLTRMAKDGDIIRVVRGRFVHPKRTDLLPATNVTSIFSHKNKHQEEEEV
jgi:hypothetical protein